MEEVSSMKDAYYFSHDSNARFDLKMLKLRARFGLEGYGFYFCLLEIMRDSSDYSIDINDLDVLAFQLGIEIEKAKNILQLCYEINLLILEDKKIVSKSFLKRMEAMNELRVKRKQAGKKGGLKNSPNKQNESKPEANLKQNESKIEALKEKKIKEKKEKEIKEKENTLNNECVCESFLKNLEFGLVEISVDNFKSIEALFFNEPITQKNAFEKTKELIEQFDEWLAAGNLEKTQNHYASLRSWAKRRITEVKNTDRGLLKKAIDHKKSNINDIEKIEIEKKEAQKRKKQWDEFEKSFEQQSTIFEDEPEMFDVEAYKKEKGIK